MSVKQHVVVIVMMADGTVTKAVQRRVPTLETLQGYVGGDIQVVPQFTMCTWEGRTYTRGTCYANEEGKLKHLPANKEATRAWWKQTGVTKDVLVGNVVYCAGTDEPFDGGGRRGGG